MKLEFISIRLYESLLLQRKNDNMNKLYFVRHGENLANITKEFSYKKVDYSLTEKGMLQAKQTAQYFIDKNIDYIYSSPLKRAKETATEISIATKIDLFIDEGFREINVGSLENNPPTKEDWNLYFKITSDWKKGNHQTSFPGGENYLMLLKRFRNSLIEAFKDRDNKKIVVVGHGGILFATVNDICMNNDIEEIAQKENHNCSINEFDIKILSNNEINCSLKKWASTDHLSGEAGIFESGLPDKTFLNE